jgi:fatty acid desaturase
MTFAEDGTLGDVHRQGATSMTNVRLFGTFRPRLNIAPLLLTPGFAAIGYAIGGAQAAWWAVAAWLAIVVGAAVSCAVHALRSAHEIEERAGRRAFDYDANNVRP